MGDIIPLLGHMSLPILDERRHINKFVEGIAADIEFERENHVTARLQALGQLLKVLLLE